MVGPVGYDATQRWVVERSVYKVMNVVVFQGVMLGRHSPAIQWSEQDLLSLFFKGLRGQKRVDF